MEVSHGAALSVITGGLMSHCCVFDVQHRVAFVFSSLPEMGQINKSKQKATKMSFCVCVCVSLATTNEKSERRLQRWIPPLGSSEHFLFVNTHINMQMHRSRHWLISCTYCHTEEIQQVRQERRAFLSMSEQTIVWWHALPTACVSCSVSD